MEDDHGLSEVILPTTRRDQQKRHIHAGRMWRCDFFSRYG
jgi:hypothetical protein